MTDPDNATPDTHRLTDTAGDDIARCLFCGQPEQLVWVHGHGQCAFCGVNAMPCCDGATCEPVTPE